MFQWTQLTDPTPLGLDVLASRTKVLVDGFLCISTDLITDIHIWGSWHRDILPVNAASEPNSSLVEFCLNLYRGITFDPATNH